MQEHYRAFSIGCFECTAIADADQGNRTVLLAESKHQRLLIDTGAGSAYHRNPGQLGERLRAAGKDPGSLDLVILSHADFDHIGGAVSDGYPVFPHAEHILLRAEADFWRARPDRLRASPNYDEAFRTWGNTIPPTAIDALADRLRLVDPGDEVAPGVTMIAALGTHRATLW